MSVDRSIPTPPPTVTGQSPNSEVFVVSVEAVEKAEEAVRDYWARADGITPMGEVRAALVGALPVIERDLRETIAKEVEAMRAHWPGAAELAFDTAAARVREGGRHA